MRVLMLSLVFLVFTFSCQKENGSSSNFTIDFTGKIGDKNSDSIIFENQNTQYRETFYVESDGDFMGQLNLPKAGYYSFSDGYEFGLIYLDEGYDLNFSLDTNEFDESLSFTGKGKEPNNYLAKKTIWLEQNSQSPKELFGLDEQEFIEQINQQEASLLKILNSTKDLDKKFIGLEKKNILFEKIILAMNYESGHRFFSKNETFVASKNIQSLIESINLDDEENLAIPSFKSFILTQFNNQQKMADKVTFVEKIESQKIKNNILKEGLFYLTPNEDGSKMYELIQKHANDKELLEKANKKYNTIKNIASGKPSPNFQFENYAGGETTLNELKGNLVYIDVWATWCGPCLQEIPSLKKLEAEYQNKNIKFVSISIDQKKDYDSWKDMIKEKNLGGIQLFADKDWSSSFVKAYAIDGIPRFILIDQEGKIINADAPRPSDPKLKELLTQSGV